MYFIPAEINTLTENKTKKTVTIHNNIILQRRITETLWTKRVPTKLLLKSFSRWSPSLKEVHWCPPSQRGNSIYTTWRFAIFEINTLTENKTKKTVTIHNNINLQRWITESLWTKRVPTKLLLKSFSRWSPSLKEVHWCPPSQRGNSIYTTWRFAIFEINTLTENKTKKNCYDP